MTETGGNPFLIPPPPAGSAKPPIADAGEPEPDDADPAPFIDLPPGVIDSATFRVEPTRIVRAERQTAPQKTERSSEEISFFPTPIGAPTPEPAAAEPAAAEPDAAEPAAAEPEPAPDPVAAASAWILTLPNGIELTLDGGRMLLGRRPVARDGDSGGVAARLVSVTDPAKSVSKTHAEFEVRDGVLLVTDLGSTNGIAIGSAGREDELVTPGEATTVESGRIVALGTFEITVARR